MSLESVELTPNKMLRELINMQNVFTSLVLPIQLFHKVSFLFPVPVIFVVM